MICTTINRFVEFNTINDHIFIYFTFIKDPGWAFEAKYFSIYHVANMNIIIYKFTRSEKIQQVELRIPNVFHINKGICND